MPLASEGEQCRVPAGGFLERVVDLGGIRLGSLLQCPADSGLWPEAFGTGHQHGSPVQKVYAKRPPVLKYVVFYQLRQYPLGALGAESDAHNAENALFQIPA